MKDKLSMPRKRSTNYNDQYATILAEAGKLFAQRGYPGTSINEVAQACGLSKPALYHYIDDKYALLCNICTEHVARLESLATVVSQKNLAPQDHLSQLIHYFVEAYADAQDAHRVLIADAKFLNDEDQKQVLDSERRIVAIFAQAVAKLHPELEIQQLHKPLTMLLFGMINWLFTWVKPTGKLSYPTIAPLVTAFFLGGLSHLILNKLPSDQ